MEVAYYFLCSEQHQIAYLAAVREAAQHNIGVFSVTKAV
jgi:hypothetical protein